MADQGVTAAAGAAHEAGVHLVWGLEGAPAAQRPDAAAVVVDVLSFSTAVTVAVGRKMAVYPHPWPSAHLEAFTQAHRAACAVARRLVDADHPWSLSPVQLAAAPAVDRLVLPSPNGSALAARLPPATVVAGCLRNASAVAAWLVEEGFGQPDRAVTVIAAGERHIHSGELRPALEDLLGAGAIIAALGADLVRSPAAAAAEAAWVATRDQLVEAMHACASGRELAHAGYRADVDFAAQLDADQIVPVLVDGAFVPARPTPRPG